MKRTRFLFLLIALLLLLALGGCGLFSGEGDAPPETASESEPGPEPDPEYPVDAGGTTLLARPGRVVSLAPSLTEKLCDLGLEARLAGVSDYCDYPSGIVGLPACGTAQLPDLEEIERLAPHLVLSETSLPEEAMAVLGGLDIPVAVLPHADGVDSLMAGYTDLARLMEGDNSGRVMADAFTGEYLGRLGRLERAAASQAGEDRPKVLYLRLLDFTVATGDTFENELLRRIGLENIAAEYTGWTYPEEAAKSAEGVAAFTSIDIIYMDEEFVTIKDLENSAFYKGLPATIKDRYFYIDSIEMERQSMRTLFLLEEMAAYAYPDLDLSGGPAARDPEAAAEEEPGTEEAGGETDGGGE